MVLRGLPGPWRPAFRPGILSNLEPRTSNLASRISHLECGSPSASLSTLGRFAGRPWCPPSLLRQSSAFRTGKAANAAHGPIWPTAAPLVRNSPRGWTPRSLTTMRLSEGEPLRGAVVGPGRSRTPGRCRCRCDAMAGTRLPNTFLAPAPTCPPTMLPRFGSTHASLRVRESLRCPPSRRVPHKWSGRRPIRTWAAQRPFRYETRRTV
jgi:hypothetical protein